MHFDGNGIRDVPELKVLQYRRTSVSSTHTFNEQVHNGSSNTMMLNGKLRLIEVAAVRNNNIMFLVGDKDNVWPGIHVDL